MSASGITLVVRLNHGCHHPTKAVPLDSLAPAKRRDDLRRRADARQARQDLLDREAMQLGVEAARGILGDDDRIILEPGVAGGRFDAEIGRDPAEDDRRDGAAAKLQVELGAKEGAPLPLGDRQVRLDRLDFRGKFGEVGRRIAGGRRIGMSTGCCRRST